MTTYTEPTRPLDFVLYEEPDLSRETLTIPNGTAAFAAGMVLGPTLTSGSAVATALSTNTGTGAIGTITVGAAAKIGNYTLLIVKLATDSGSFILTDPDGLLVGKGAVASAFNVGGLSFTLADATDYVPGDGFNIAVTGTYKYLPYDDGNTDGSNVARAIALYPCDASAAEATVAGLVRAAGFNTAAMSWHASSDATAKTKAYADLAKSMLIARSL